MATSITGRTALVTGGGTGIGLGAATRLAADGARVVICGRTEDTLRAAVEQVAPSVGEGGSIAHVVADVTDEEQITAAVAAAAEPTGGLDIVFANAGGSLHMGPIAEADATALRATVDVNLVGTMLTMKAAVPAMRAAGGGSIIGMSSGAGSFPHRYLWAYGASKAGIDMLCRSAADELGADGIRVNSVQPGIVDDELMSFITAGGPLLDQYLANMPVSRVGTVEDIAEAVRFLAGPESAWITGVNLPVDGGHHLRTGGDYGLLFG
ncbi:glucose 1-dehydrogenase [Iamia majanohamensis]|uniref:Glucose 1-dehydrogenase n=1 Tax=Iamia majanohamensis TaxID=467976 RepID=A0AAE9YBK5_9ACTN|nr:glucose 1-dehydrogenase [Iamia majanohamensis]WCO68088.1 glucose 1-dehydrogenase [Iamia majanohamensis]